MVRFSAFIMLLAAGFCIFCPFRFLWDFLSVCPFYRGIFILFVSPVRCSCWRAVARQPSILYNSEIWPKSVGCKIVHLRSRMLSLYPGACGFGDLRSRFRATASHICLLLVEGFIEAMNGLVMTLKQTKCFAAHSQYSLPVEALNVIVELSKSLPVPLR